MNLKHISSLGKKVPGINGDPLGAVGWMNGELFGDSLGGDTTVTAWQ